MSCQWNRETERFDLCDGHWKCHCSCCSRCGEPSYQLNKQNLCPSCVNHFVAQEKKEKCFCFDCEEEREWEMGV